VNGFASGPGGVIDVAMWFCALLLVGLWSSLVPIPNNVVLVPGNTCGDPHHVQGHYARGLLEWFKEARGFDFEYSSNIQLKLKLFFSFFMHVFN
jgi:hypothetical protein